MALFDLVTPDGKLLSIERLDDRSATAQVLIENIASTFQGRYIDAQQVFFNGKSTLAQLGLDIRAIDCAFSSSSALVHVKITAYGKYARILLSHLTQGAYVGKLFAADDRRMVHHPDYLSRMFNRTDRSGDPLLYLGDPFNSEHFSLEKHGDSMVASLALLPGTISYDPCVEGFLEPLAKALHDSSFHLRKFLGLLQCYNPEKHRLVQEDEILLVKTRPLHIRTAFARVHEELLPLQMHHTSASILEPETQASGDVYELFGTSSEEILTIPLEFYTLEPYKEHVFFSDRDQLQHCLEDETRLFHLFDTAPLPKHHKASCFIVKSAQLLHLEEKDWITRDPHFYDFPGMMYHAEQQSFLVDKYIEQQPCYMILKAMEEGEITSQGVLFSRYFPSPLMKKMFLSDRVHHCLKGIYFQRPSHSYGDFFSHEDRSMLHDLAQFAIPVYWIDRGTGRILRYVPKPHKDTGMFVPLAQVEDFLKAASFGVYGSNLVTDVLEQELIELFQGLEMLRQEINHPLLHAKTPIALVTGGGPGVMALGNKIAKSLNLLSCANIVDFQAKSTSVVHEQLQNPYVDIKMTYRLDRLVERQAEFHLDFPIFLKGGIGTDFEYSLEEVRRKVGSTSSTPVLLFGPPSYWKEKISSRFQCNIQSGTIQGSEWISNCFYCVQSAKQALVVYKKFFSGHLPIGKEGPVFPDGFVTVTQPPVSF